MSRPEVRLRKLFRNILLSTVGCLAVVSQCHASSAVWTGNGTDSNWSTANNWSSSLMPANDGSADITMAGANRLSPNVDTAWNIDSLNFDSTANAFVLGGQTLTIGAGGMSNSGNSVQKVNNAIVLSADQSWTAGTVSGGYLFSDTSLNTNGHALTFTGSNQIVLQGTVSGTGSLNVSMTAGAGVLVDSANTSYSGGTFINQGELYVTGDSALGAAGSPITISNGASIYGLTSGTVNRDITLNAGGGQIGGPAAQFDTLVLSGPIHGVGSLTLNSSSGCNNSTDGTKQLQRRVPF